MIRTTRLYLHDLHKVGSFIRHYDCFFFQLFNCQKDDYPVDRTVRIFKISKLVPLLRREVCVHEST